MEDLKVLADAQTEIKAKSLIEDFTSEKHKDSDEG